MRMQKTVVIDVVGLTHRMLGPHTPFMTRWTQQTGVNYIRPQVPAVTCTMQATYLTGTTPRNHGIVGNGWYFREECEVKFWRQSNKLVQAPKIWENARSRDPEFTCANLFWWYNMYSTVNYSVTPRPNYLADGRKIPDVYSEPSSLRDDLQKELGQFPLFEFWGPGTSIRSSQWIADAAKITDERYNPTLTLIYLPHLDYCLQKYGHQEQSIGKDLQDIDRVVADLVTYYRGKGAEIVLLSEYGITEVNQPVALNRVLRNHGWLQIREERGLELLDAGASKAFAVCDHQVAHVYAADPADVPELGTLLREVPGVGSVWNREQIQEHDLDHPRSGDLVVLAEPRCWFTYYYWLDDAKAPDFARTVDIHRKPGYDPLEMLIDPSIKMAKPLIVWKLLRKRLGFRVLMDVIPLDASLIKGSHGIQPESKKDWPLICASGLEAEATLDAVQVYDVLWKQLTGDQVTGTG